MKTIVAALLLFITLPASAIPITVNGIDYNVKWRIGSFNDVNAAINLMDEPWWGDSTLAGTFASNLGFRDDRDLLSKLGPQFVYESVDTGYFFRAVRDTGSLQFGSNGGLTSGNLAFAYTVPESGSLALLVLGLVGFIVSRKVRH